MLNHFVYNLSTRHGIVIHYIIHNKNVHQFGVAHNLFKTLFMSDEEKHGCNFDLPQF